MTSGEDPLFSLSDVKVRVGNAAPSIIDVPSVAVPVSLIPGTTKPVVVQFTARDPNGAEDLNDAAVSATISKDGVERFGICTVNSQKTKEKTYDCAVEMQYYDAKGDWAITFYVEDLAETPGSDTDSSAIPSVGELKAINYNTNVDLGTSSA